MDQTRLYYQIPYVKSFMGTVTACTPAPKKEGAWLVALNQTGFYPEGGGQPGDTGFLDGVRVLDTQERDGEVLHVTEAPLETGRLVEGIIDWQERYDNMQHHTGEHILSGILHRRYGLDNVGFHMGSREVTMDFNGPLTEEQLKLAEEEANGVIYANVPVKEAFYQGEELKGLEYRSKKELQGLVRIITVPGADQCACCGTHVAFTGEVGIIKVTGMIRYKGGVRISMLCGRRALLDYDRRIQAAERISSLLSAKEEEIDQAVERFKEESQERDMQLNRLRQRYFALKAESLKESGEPLALFEEELNPVGVRQLCTLLYEGGKGSVVLVCSEKSQGEYQYALGSARADMGALSRSLGKLLEGRGGGSRLMAQGTLRGSREQISEVFVREAKKALAAEGGGRKE